MKLREEIEIKVQPRSKERETRTEMVANFRIMS